MARPVTAARRYAEAAFEIALRDDQLDRWRDDLRLAAEVLASPDVARVIENPAVPARTRREIVAKSLGSRLLPSLQRLIELLVERGRIELLPRVASEYARLLSRHRGIVSAIVTSAIPLSDSETTAIRGQVERMAGSAVELETRVDAAIIGGLTVQVGDRLLDDSVRGRLERLRAQLHAGARPR
jgi:F-type H+-transporting ATPase subunit delta